MTSSQIELNHSTGSTFSDQIRVMFNSIAPIYDLLNCLLSFGRDRYWRKTAVDALEPVEGQKVLDLATGTANMVLEIAGRFTPGKIQIFGVDFSQNMLSQGIKKVSFAGLNHSTFFISANGEALPFPNNSFDGATIAFGIRNFSNIKRGLDELFRTLAPGGRLSILEFSIPRQMFFRKVYLFYFKRILPWIGQKVSGNHYAYQYLPESVSAFPEKEEFITCLKRTGFEGVVVQELTGGIVSLYTGYKNENT